MDGSKRGEDRDMPDEQMLREHTQAWNGFVKISAISAGLVALTLALMAIFLT